MTPQPAAEYVIPGLKVGCLPFDAMIASTLECFYSAECLNETTKRISNLLPSSWPKPLNSSAHTTFQPTDTLTKILDHSVVDDWETTKTFENYYNACAPIECVHSALEFSGFLYLISTIMGLCGGLIVALRTIVPVLVRIGLDAIERISRYFRPNMTVTAAYPGNYHRLRQVISSF